MRRAGIVLCGGRSRRMGRPKALLPWFGRTLVEHVVAQLAPCVDAVFVVTARDLPVGELVTPLGARVVVDRESARGPLAALRDGLVEARAGLAFVTATDAPFLAPPAVEALLARAEARAAGGDRRAVVPRAGSHLQVLSAVYPGEAWREAAALLDAERADGAAARDASPMRLLERIGFEAIESLAAIDASVAAGAPEVGGASSSSPLSPPSPWTSFNTPDDYLALARRRDPSASASIVWATAPPGAPDAPPRTVPIGSLGEVLRASAPVGLPADVLDDREALAGLSVSLGEGGLALRLAGLRTEDLALPIGPGERLRISAR